MRWFGKSWGAPANAEEDHAPVPVGAPCIHCEEEIAAQDPGFILDGGRGDLPLDRCSIFHYECFMRGVTGSLAHVERRCSCFIPGSECGDPDGMTRRQAARAAVEAHERLLILKGGKYRAM